MVPLPALLLVVVGTGPAAAAAVPLPARIVVANNATDTERWSATKLAELLLHA